MPEPQPLGTDAFDILMGRSPSNPSAAVGNQNNPSPLNQTFGVSHLPSGSSANPYHVPGAWDSDSDSSKGNDTWTSTQQSLSNNSSFSAPYPMYSVYSQRPPPALIVPGASDSRRGLSAGLGGLTAMQPSFGMNTGTSNNLQDIIARTSGYDYLLGVDQFGAPLPQRITNYMQDVIDDPRKSAEQIKELLSNIRPDMDIPVEDRQGTPDAMKYALMPHQQVALTWMQKSEDGRNKGGLLADAMGLGKTISTLALMVSRKASTPAVKVRTPFYRLLLALTNSTRPISLLRRWHSFDSGKKRSRPS